MPPKKKKVIPARAKSAEETLLDLLSSKSGRRRQPLSDEAQRNLLMMLTMQSNPLALDIERLIPAGSFLKRVQRHFDDTDISYALPIFQTVMIAASWLTQHGARLEIDGMGEVLPSLWTIALAESGSAKTLAASRMTTILGDGFGAPPVRMLPSPGSDAQWIVDLADNNGSYWFQDEVGKFIAAVLTNKLFSRIKPWMLSSYSHEPIGNRLRGEKEKLQIEKPVFTFLGLSVFSTWQQDVDAVSMLDGFLQRPNYVVATARTDTDLFDHFIYFAGAQVGEREADLRDLWNALCAQPGAAGVYKLNPDVLPFLRRWWLGLRNTWGQSGVPSSFVRRIGFSVLRYLMVVHFLLGKSRHPVDVETAHLATRFAEFHFESAREMLQAYDRTSVERVRKIMDVRAALTAAGMDASARSVQRRLGKAVRDGLTSETLRVILDALDRVDVGDPFPATLEGRREKAATLAVRLEGLEKRLHRSERKRNERRLRNLREAYLAAAGSQPGDDAPAPDAAPRFDDPAVTEDDLDHCGLSDDLDGEAFFERMFEGGHEQHDGKVVQFRSREA